MVSTEQSALGTLQKAQWQIPETDDPACRAAASLLIALCHARGEPGGKDKARAAFVEAVRLLEPGFRQEDSGDLMGWVNWLSCQILRREAEPLITSLSMKEAPIKGL
jgi:hypothetical protein